MKIKTPFLPSFVFIVLSLFSCEESDVPTDPGAYVGRYSLCELITCEAPVQVNIRPNLGTNTGVIMLFENLESTDIIAHYEISGTAYKIYNWDSIHNGSYSIEYWDRDRFHLARMDGFEIYFEKRQ